MTLAWLQLSYRQTEAYSFSTGTAVAFITAKIVASLRDTACCHRNRRFQLQKAVTFHVCASTVYFSAIGTKAFCACAALESLLWFVTFWPICNEHQSINTERFEGVANFRSKRRSLCHSTVVAVSLRSRKVCEADVELVIGLEVLEQRLGSVKGEDVSAFR